MYNREIETKHKDVDDTNRINEVPEIRGRGCDYVCNCLTGG